MSVPFGEGTQAQKEVEDMPIPNIPELLIILVIILLVFGAGKLPDVAGSLGKGIREFRRAQNGMEEQNSTGETAETTEKTEKKEEA